MQFSVSYLLLFEIKQCLAMDVVPVVLPPPKKYMFLFCFDVLSALSMKILACITLLHNFVKQLYHFVVNFADGETEAENFATWSFFRLFSLCTPEATALMN